MVQRLERRQEEDRGKERKNSRIRKVGITYLGRQLREPALIGELIEGKLSRRDLSVCSHAGWTGLCYAWKAGRKKERNGETKSFWRLGQEKERRRRKKSREGKERNIKKEKKQF